jgi:predicted nucleic acid-binding protein
LYGKVLLPRVVAEELSAKPGSPGALATTLAWVDVREMEADDAVVRLLSASLDAGEAAAVGLAVRVHADLCLMDDRAGRAAAERLGITVKGTLGVLLQGKRAGHVTELRPVLNRLRDTGLFLSDQLVAEVLRAGGE